MPGSYGMEWQDWYAGADDRTWDRAAYTGYKRDYQVWNSRGNWKGTSIHTIDEDGPAWMKDAHEKKTYPTGGASYPFDCSTDTGEDSDGTHASSKTRWSQSEVQASAFESQEVEVQMFQPTKESRSAARNFYPTKDYGIATLTSHNLNLLSAEKSIQSGLTPKEDALARLGLRPRKDCVVAQHRGGAQSEYGGESVTSSVSSSGLSKSAKRKLRQRTLNAAVSERQETLSVASAGMTAQEIEEEEKKLGRPSTYKKKQGAGMRQRRKLMRMSLVGTIVTQQKMQQLEVPFDAPPPELAAELLQITPGQRDSATRDKLSAWLGAIKALQDDLMDKFDLVA